MCNSEECVSARISLQGVQMRIFALCQQMNFVRERMYDSFSAGMTFSIFATMFLAAAMIAGIVGFIFPGVPQAFALAMFALSAAFFLLSVIFFEAARAFEKQLKNLAEEMQKLLSELAAAVNVVMENCPPECWESIDFTAPSC